MDAMKGRIEKTTSLTSLEVLYNSYFTYLKQYSTAKNCRQKQKRQRKKNKSKL